MIISGKVKIIKKPKDYYKIKDEVIIIAKNTTPDIVVVINKVLVACTPKFGHNIPHKAVMV